MLEGIPLLRGDVDIVLKYDPNREVVLVILTPPS